MWPKIDLVLLYEFGDERKCQETLDCNYKLGQWVDRIDVTIAERCQGRDRHVHLVPDLLERCIVFHSTILKILCPIILVQWAIPIKCGIDSPKDGYDHSECHEEFWSRSYAQC